VTCIGQESIALSIRIESISAALEPVRNQIPAPVPVLSNRAGDTGRSLWGINLRSTDKDVAGTLPQIRSILLVTSSSSWMQLNAFFFCSIECLHPCGQILMAGLQS